MKKISLTVFVLSLVSLAGYYFWNNNKISGRTPSSVEIDRDQIISTVRWDIQENKSEIGVDLSCDNWSSMEVTLKAEGVAYSGEPSRMIQTALCGEYGDGFYQVWPHNLMKDYEGIQKIGLYNEPPPEWTLEKIKFFGSLGAVEISGVEIYRRTGEIFIFDAY